MLGKFKQGDILEVDLAPVKGHEQDGKRPVVVMSGDTYNNYCGSLIIVAPISNTDSKFPMHIPIPGNNPVTGQVLTQHLRTLDAEERVIRKIGTLDAETLEKCKLIFKSIAE